MIIYSKNPLKRSVFGHICVVFATICSLLLIPGSLLTLLIAYLYRSAVKSYVKHFRPDFGNILPLRGSIFSVDAPGEPCGSSIFHNFILKGKVDFNKLQNDISVKVKQRNPEGELKYPELQQFGASFAGYSFWKWDKNFDIKNHLRLGYNGKTSLNLQTLNELTAKEIREPYYRSPWEVFVFPDFKFFTDKKAEPRNRVFENPEFSAKNDLKPRSAVLVRFSHVLVDGNSIAEILAGCSDVPVPRRRSKNSDRSTWQRVAYKMMNCLLLPYQLTGLYWDTWDGRLLRSTNSGPLVVRFSEPIPMSFIKGLKNKLRVSFGAVLMSAYTGGLRKLMLENKISTPVAVHSFMPMPMLGHKDQLRNKMKFGYVTMPVGVDDPEKRLKLIDSQQKALAKSRLPSQMYYVDLAIGIMPSVFKKNSFSIHPYSGMVTNFPFPNEGLAYDGNTVEHVFDCIGLFYGNTAISVTAVSYEGSIIIAASYVNSSILKGNPNTFLDGTLEELKILSDLDNLKQSHV